MACCWPDATDAGRFLEINQHAHTVIQWARLCAQCIDRLPGSSVSIRPVSQGSCAPTQNVAKRLVLAHCSSMATAHQANQLLPRPRLHRLAQQLLNIFDALHLLLLVVHHSQRRRAAVTVSRLPSVVTNPRQDSHKLLPLLNLQHPFLDAPLHDESFDQDLALLP